LIFVSQLIARNKEPIANAGQATAEEVLQRMNQMMDKRQQGR
jgi:hypothetical protein